MEKNQDKSKLFLKLYDDLGEMFPNAKCELNYCNHFELLVATVLSAQTTDISVNKVTPMLFASFSSPDLLANADYWEVYGIIKFVGLASTKTKNIIALAKSLRDHYNSIVPDRYDELIKLPGVGRKTANVVLSEAFDIPRIAVDTHVSRVSNRLGLSKHQDVTEIEKDLMEIFPKELWKKVHLRLLFFGRYLCLSQKPKCNECPFTIFCQKLNR